jgi:hypothetical protein
MLQLLMSNPTLRKQQKTERNTVPVLHRHILYAICRFPSDSGSYEFKDASTTATPLILKNRPLSASPWCYPGS